MEKPIPKNNKGSNRLSLLPPNTRELLTSPELSEKLLKICIKYNLADKTDKEGFIIDPRTKKLIEVVIKILKGELSLVGFNKIMEKELGIGPATVEKIAAEIDQDVFSNIRTDLKKLSETKISKKTAIPSTKTTGVLAPKKSSANKKSDIYRELIK